MSASQHRKRHRLGEIRGGRIDLKPKSHRSASAECGRGATAGFGGAIPRPHAIRLGFELAAMR
jgi:hypothetical protein